jgi:hypothetical protein
MKKKSWQKKITESCVEAGTYRPFFDIPISQLAEILEMRDDAMKQYRNGGGQTVVEHTNKADHTNVTKNPALTIVDDLTKTALAYWRDLGLTPAGLKNISKDALKTQKKSALAEALSEI